MSAHKIVKGAVARHLVEPLEPRRLLAAVTFVWDPPPNTPNPHSLRFDLDLPQVPTQATLSLTNLTSGQSISPVSMATGTWSGGASAIFTFPAYTNGVVNGVLPDGNYYGLLLDRAQPQSQQILLSSEFFVFAGDTNHNRFVNLPDFNVVAANFGGTNKRFSEGDVNYDSIVNLADFNLVAGRFGTELSEPTVPVKLTSITTSPEEISLNWSAFASDAASAASYRLLVSYDGTNFNQSAPLEGTDTYATVQGLDFNMTVHHRVEALDAGGSVIGTSNSTAATTPSGTQPSYQSPNPAAGAGVTPLLVSWYGIDTLNTLSAGDWRIESISDALGGTVNPNDFDQDGKGDPYKFDAGPRAIIDLLAKIDGANGNPRDMIITQAEVNSVRVRMLAFSWGSMTAVNQSRKLSATGNLYFYNLTVPIPIESLVVLDPIHNGPARAARWVWFSGVLSNVQKFTNYYQTKGDFGSIRWGTGPGKYPNNDPYFNIFVALLKGTTLPTTIGNSTQVNITTDPAHANRFQERVYKRNVSHVQTVFGRNRGNENNHLTLPWYIAPRAIVDLEPTYMADFFNPPEDFLVDRPQRAIVPVPPRGPRWWYAEGLLDSFLWPSAHERESLDGVWYGIELPYRA